MIAPRTTRLRTAALWIVPMLAAGGYWYVRNLIAVGNPIPYVGSVGPISLPAPVRDFHLRPDFAVVHYWTTPACGGTGSPRASTSRSAPCGR